MIPPEEDSAAAEPNRADAGGEFRECIRRTLQVTGELYGGLAGSLASASRAFCEEIHPERVMARGLATSWLIGIAQSNARFLDCASDVLKQVGGGTGESGRPERKSAEGTTE